MGNDQYLHYKDYGKPALIGPPRPEFQSIHFEAYVTDDEVRELLSPFKAQSISRRDRGDGAVEFFATYLEAKPFRQKFKDYCKKRYHELAPIWEAEREARFQEYYKSLNLDEWIEIPCIYTYTDGRPNEKGTYKFNPGKK